MKLDATSLAHTKWECEYDLCLRRNIGDRSYEDKARYRADAKEIV